MAQLPKGLSSQETVKLSALIDKSLEAIRKGDGQASVKAIEEFQGAMPPHRAVSRKSGFDSQDAALPAKTNV